MRKVLGHNPKRCFSKSLRSYGGLLKIAISQQGKTIKIGRGHLRRGNTTVAPQTLAPERHLLPNDTCSPNSWGCRRESEWGWGRRWGWRCGCEWGRDREWVSVLIGAWSGPREQMSLGSNCRGSICHGTLRKFPRYWRMYRDREGQARYTFILVSDDEFILTELSPFRL
jgi:hypothetical protein